MGQNGGRHNVVLAKWKSRDWMALSAAREIRVVKLDIYDQCMTGDGGMAQVQLLCHETRAHRDLIYHPYHPPTRDCMVPRDSATGTKCAQHVARSSLQADHAHSDCFVFLGDLEISCWA
jgi:hypothetical protein